MSDLLLGLDIGTSSSKAVLTRPDGTVVASAVREHSVSTPRPGFVEHDAEAVWLADLIGLVGRAETPTGQGTCGGRHQRHRPVPAAGGHGRFAAAPGHPVWRRHPGRRRDRRVDVALRRGRDPRALRFGADHPGDRAEDRLAAQARTRRVGADAAAVHRQFVPGARPHRRVRARPPHREPVDAAVRQPAQRVDRRLGQPRSPPASRCPRLAWPGEIVGVVGDARGRTNRTSGGHARHRRDGRRLG